MEIILLKDVEKVGKRGEVVSIKDGFGRNFLFPRGLALPATRQNQALIEREKKRADTLRARKKGEAEQLAQQLALLHLQVEAEVGEKDKMFGSVTPQDLQEALAKKGISLDKKQFRLSEPIRSLGVHPVTVELDSEVRATLQVEVTKKV